jgi:hypothetical protein
MLQASDLAHVVANMGRHHFEHGDGRGWVDFVQLVIAIAAVLIAGAAFWFTRREGIRAGNVNGSGGCTRR